MDSIKKFTILFLLSLINIVPFSSNAKSLCTPTREIYPISSPPEEFSKRNNLRRALGDAHFAQGTALWLKGTVKNADCRIISNAVILLWHEASERDDNNYFLGSGTTSSNNIGAFDFLTILPKKIGEHPLHVNLRVEHAGASLFESQLLLELPTNYKKTNDPILAAKLSQLPVASISDNEDGSKTADFTLFIDLPDPDQPQ